MASWWLNMALTSLPEAEGCKLCPVNWTLHGTKCYWVANGVRVWSASRDDCGNRGAELLMPGDRDELVKGAMASGVWDGVWDCARGAGGTGERAGGTGKELRGPGRGWGHWGRG